MGENKNGWDIPTTFKVIQSFFIALFLFGISNAAGDLTPVFNIPISAFSMTTITYGLFGMIACEWFIRRIK